MYFNLPKNKLDETMKYGEEVMNKLRKHADKEKILSVTLELISLTAPVPKEKTDGKVAVYASAPDEKMLEQEISEITDCIDKLGEDYITYKDICDRKAENRPGFEKLMLDLRSGKFKRLYVDDLGSLAGENAQIPKVAQELSELGVKISDVEVGYEKYKK